MTRSTLPRAVVALGLFGLMVLAADRLTAQAPPAKKVVTFADFDIWNSPPTGMTLSKDGKYIAYRLMPMEAGDGEVIVRHVPSGKEMRIAVAGRAPGAVAAEEEKGEPTAPTGPAPKGLKGLPGGGGFGGAAAGSPTFTPDVKKVLVQITPPRGKGKTDDAPKAGLAVIDLEAWKVTETIPQVSAYTVAGDGAGLLLYRKQAANVGGGKGDEKEAAPQPPAPQPGGKGAGGGKGGGGKGAGGGKGGNVGQPGAKQPNPTNPAPKQPVDPTDPTQPPVDPTNPDSPPFGPQAPVDPDGRRDLTWRPDGNGMSFLQLEPARAKDDKETRKDRVMQWLPPFGKDDAKVVFESPNRITAVQYSDDCQWLFVTQTVSNQRQVTALDMKDGKKPYVISGVGAPMGVEPAPMPKDKSLPDPADGDDDPDDEQQPKKGGGPGGFGAAAAAGGLMTRAVGTGVNVVRISSTGDVYMSGTATGAKPYIDAIDIKTGKKTRIFEGKYDGTETIAAVDGNDIKKVFTTREKADVPPDSFVTDLATGTVTKLTNNVDPAPWARKLKTERFQVTRVDGFKFWVRVTLPPNAPPKLPALFWIYPREYTDQAQYNAQAGRAPGTGGPAGAGGAGRFTTPGARAMSIVTLAGYALVEPDVPIVGPAGRMNDNYIPDLRNSLWAAIDECDKRGIIDRDRLACGGHSYGAFSTANAMAHTPFFKAGIAGDGCYNRTLTAMSFQSERRHIWDAREMYLEMSPLLWANRMNGALLMYHGMEDANVGTNPINAEMLYLALDGLGKDAALYMYPYEGHGPIAKETTLDLWARWVGWLDVYVKNPKKK